MCKICVEDASLFLKTGNMLFFFNQRGILVIFFYLFNNLLNAVKKHLGPVVGSPILLPRLVKYLLFALVMVLLVAH